jgi:chromosome partitioning protein
MKRERLVALTEWAARVGISYFKAYQMARAGEIPTRKVGSRLFVVEEAEVPQKRGVALTFFTHAGGAGKTSLARDLGYELASRGYRVLLMDMDPQANLTTWVGVDPQVVRDEDTAIPVVEGKSLPEPRKNVLGEGVPLDLIPANVNLAVVEVVAPTRPAGMAALRMALEETDYRERYDFILIDSPPSLGPIAAMSALAADGLVVPVETSGKGIQALRAVSAVSRDYLRTLKALRFLPKETQTFVKLLVPTKYDARTGQDRKIRELLEDVISGVPLSPPLPYRPAPYKEAIAKGLPVQLTGDKKLTEEVGKVAEALIEVLGFSANEEVRPWV